MASTIQVRLDDDLKTRSDILFKKLGTSKKHADQGYIRDAEDDFVLFRIVGDTVIIDNIFHNLQDYENKIY